MEEEPTQHRRRSGSIALAAGSSLPGASQSNTTIRKGSLVSIGPSDTKPNAVPKASETARSSSDVEMDEMRSGEDILTSDDEETGLTRTERRKQKRRKSRNTRLDERVVADAGDMHKMEKKLARANILRAYAINTALIALWYSFSISISVYNKWMFSKENLDFHYPLFTTSLHMAVQFTLASLVLFFVPSLRPSAGSVDPHDQGYTQVDGNEDSPATTSNRDDDPPQKSTIMTRWFYLTRIGPCGTATALDIGLGNFSLRFISLTFFTMCKSSVLAFVLLFALIFRLESPSWRLGLIILFMTAGVVMMVAGETAFSALGFILVMTASFCSGFRWSLTQILLLRNPATSNPFSSIFFLTPVMFVALVVLALPIEGFGNLMEGMRILGETKGPFLGALIMLFPGALAFLMVAAEFALLKRTSVVTLSVCGIFKEVLTISAAGVVFGDELSPINVSGLVVTIASIGAYNYLKYSKMKAEERRKAHERLHPGDGRDAEDDDGARKSGERYDEVGALGGHNESTRQNGPSALMRDSLSIGTGDFGPPPPPQQNGSQSPVKKPENLE